MTKLVPLLITLPKYKGLYDQRNRFQVEEHCWAALCRYYSLANCLNQNVFTDVITWSIGSRLGNSWYPLDLGPKGHPTGEGSLASRRRWLPFLPQVVADRRGSSADILAPKVLVHHLPNSPVHVATVSAFAYMVNVTFCAVHCPAKCLLPCFLLAGLCPVLWLSSCTMFSFRKACLTWNNICLCLCCVLESAGREHRSLSCSSSLLLWPERWRTEKETRVGKRRADRLCI